MKFVGNNIKTKPKYTIGLGLVRGNILLNILGLECSLYRLDTL